MEGEVENERQLNPLHSYRLEVDFGRTVEVRLKSGKAEVFGAELSPYITYKFTATKVAIFTWHGCTFTIKGKTLKEYDWDESKGHTMPSLIYVNVHTYLNQQRELALVHEQIGPRVLVTGSNISGKSSVCKILLNYAAKTGWKPIFCDLDITNNETFVQSTMGATVLESYYPDNFFEHPSLVYFYGYLDIASHTKLYQEQVKRLGACVNSKLQEDLKKAKADLFQVDMNSEKEIPVHQEKMTSFSGIVVNMGPWSQNMNYDSIKETLAVVIDAFNIDTVLVIDDQSLNRTVEEIAENKPVVIESLPKSGGVVQIDEKHKKEKISKKFEEYFYGIDERYRIKRHIVELPFDKFRLYKIGTLSEDVLPAYSSALSLMIPVKVDCRKLNIKKIVGVLNLTKNENEEPSLEEIMSSSLSYLVYIQEIKLETGKVVLLFPGPEEFVWTNAICLDSEIYSHIK